MTGYSPPGRPGGELDEPLLDMIFDRRPLPPEAPSEMHDVAKMLSALAGPAEPGELAGEAATLAVFSRLASPAGVSPAASRSGRRRPSPLRRGRIKLAAVLLTAVAGLGTTVAAYAGVLPSPVQEVAHTIAGAPAPQAAPRHHHRDLHLSVASGLQQATPSAPRSASRPHSPQPSRGAAHSEPFAKYQGNTASPNPVFDHGSPQPGYGSAGHPCATSSAQASRSSPGHGPGGISSPAPGVTGCPAIPTPTPTASPSRLAS